MKRSVFQIACQTDTTAFGRVLAALVQAGDVIGLTGDLGAGKTFLTGAVAHALGVPTDIPVTSPTFTLIKEYSGRIPVYHMDLYRIQGPGELYDLGIWEYYEGDGVCLVEWSNRHDDLWPEYALVLDLELGQGERRTIRARGVGRGAELVEGLVKGAG